VATVSVSLQVASPPEWYPNVVDHWLLWLALGGSLFAIIIVAGWIRRRMAQNAGQLLERRGRGKSE